MKNNQILLAKLEVTEQTDPTMDGSAVIETVDGINWTTYDGDKVTRNVDSSIPSAQREVNKSPHQTAAFNVDGAGSGTAGTAPAFGCLLQACGFTETLVATTSATYTLSHAKSKTVALARYLGDSMIQKMLGARGNLSIDFSDFIRLNFQNFKGTYIRPTTGTFPGSLTYGNYADPLPINKANTVIVDLDGEPLEMTGGNISFGSGASFLNLPNQEKSLHGTNFATGQVTFLAPSLATKNWFSKMESHSGIELIEWDMEHGTAEGNIIGLNSSSVQLSNVTETTVNDEVAFTCDLKFITAPTIAFT